MVMPIDQGSILRSGAALIPDLQQQLMQQQQMDMQRQSFGLQQQKFAVEQQEAMRELAEKQAYDREMDMIGGLSADQQPAAIAALARRFPKQSEALKRSWDMQDQALKDANFRDTASLYYMIRNGGAAKAAETLRKRIEADRAAGQDTEDDEAIALALESGDEAEINRAMAAVTAQLQVAAGPDKFASISGVVAPDKIEFQKKYEYIKQQFGDAAAESFARDEYDKWVESNGKYGTNFYRSSEIPTLGQGAPQRGSTGGGGDTGGNVSGGKGKPVADAKSVARGLFPNIAITSARRDPNSALGKANPKSFHNSTDAAIDVKPIPGMTFGEYVKRYRDAGYTILEAKNEVGKGRSAHATGDHWHIVLGGGPSGGPVRVTSKAQRDKLAPGTVYIAPDGSRKVKS